MYHSSTATTLNNSVIEQIIPITPSFDQSVIDDTKSRQSVDPLYDLQNAPAQIPASSGATLAVPPTPTIQASSTNATGSATSL